MKLHMRTKGKGRKDGKLLNLIMFNMSLNIQSGLFYLYSFCLSCYQVFWFCFLLIVPLCDN